MDTDSLSKEVSNKCTFSTFFLDQKMKLLSEIRFKFCILTETFSHFHTHHCYYFIDSDIRRKFRTKTHFPAFKQKIQGVSTKIFEPNNSVIFQRIFVKFKMLLL
jgi:hypothetical protein